MIFTRAIHSDRLVGSVTKPCLYDSRIFLESKAGIIGR